MATKELIQKLDFRRFTAPVAGLAKIKVHYGTDVAASAGHATARKFVKNYLPAILYSNPKIEVRVERSDALNSTPSITAVQEDGQERRFDTKALSAAFPKAGDREIFRQLTGVDAEIAEVKRKKRKTRKPAKAAAAAEGGAEAEAQPDSVASAPAAAH